MSFSRRPIHTAWDDNLPWRHAIVVIASASRPEDRGFESRVLQFIRLPIAAGVVEADAMSLIFQPAGDGPFVTFIYYFSFPVSLNCTKKFYMYIHRGFPF
jgi:hypothetical protein